MNAKQCPVQELAAEFGAFGFSSTRPGVQDWADRMNGLGGEDKSVAKMQRVSVKELLECTVQYEAGGTSDKLVKFVKGAEIFVMCWLEGDAAPHSYVR